MQRKEGNREIKEIVIEKYKIGISYSIPINKIPFNDNAKRVSIRMTQWICFSAIQFKRPKEPSSWVEILYKMIGPYIYIYIYHIIIYIPVNSHHLNILIFN